MVTPYYCYTCLLFFFFLFLFIVQGICPGNRLRLLVGQYDTGGCLVGSRPDLTISEDGIQRHGKRRSWHVQPNRVSYLCYTIPLLNSRDTEHFYGVGARARLSRGTSEFEILWKFFSAKFSLRARRVTS